jgi:MoxR-like ATPase
MNQHESAATNGVAPAQEGAKWEVGQVVEGIHIGSLNVDIESGIHSYFFRGPNGALYGITLRPDEIEALAQERGSTFDEIVDELEHRPVTVTIVSDPTDDISHGEAKFAFDAPTVHESGSASTPETHARLEVGAELPGVTFSKVDLVNRAIILKSSSRDRKIVKVVVPLDTYEGEGEPSDYYSNRTFTLRILEDSDPSDPMNGQYLAEIVSTPWTDTGYAVEQLSEDEIRQRVETHTYYERHRRALSYRLYQLTGITEEKRAEMTVEDILKSLPASRRRLVERMIQQEKNNELGAATLLGDPGVPEAIEESRWKLIAAIRKQDELQGRAAELHKEEAEILFGVDGSPVQEELMLLEEIRSERERVEKSEQALYQESPEAYYGLHLRELKEFKRALTEGKIVETEYVEKQSNDVEAHLRAGQPVLVYGHLGTGKTELAISVAEKMLRDRPDVLERIEARLAAWMAEHPDGSEREQAEERAAITKDETSPLVISGYKHASTTEFFGHQNLSIDKVDMEKVREEIREIEQQFEAWKSEYTAAHPEVSGSELDAELARGHERILEANLTRMQGGTISTYFLGPIYRAMQEGRTLIIDEVNAIPHEVLISLNHILTRKPGDIVSVQQDSGMKIEVKEGYGIIMTGNINQGDSRYIDRQDLDPAFLSRLHRIEHDYLPQKIEGTLGTEAGEGNELYQVMLARIMDKRGNMDVPEGTPEALWLLAQAARVTQEVFSGKNKNDKYFYTEGIGRPVSYTLVEGVMSMRGIEKVINQWQKEGYAHELDHYLFNEFINQPTVTADKAYLYQLFRERFGFFAGDGWPKNMDYTKLKSDFSVTSPALPAQHPIHYDARAVVDYAFGEMKQG